MKDRLFLDTNIMLDFLGNRAPFYDSIAKIVTKAEKQELILVVSTLSFATASYILLKYAPPQKVIEALHKFRTLVEVSDLTSSVLDKGLTSNFIDFEDSLQYFSAVNSNCNFLITRNAKDFKNSTIPVMLPDEYLKL